MFHETTAVGGDVVKGGQFERRLTLRMVAYWERLRLGRLMPEEADIHPEDLHELWDDCFLIHAGDAEPEGYRFIYLGNNIRHALSGGMPDNSETFMQSLNVKLLTPAVHQVVQSALPNIDEGELLNDVNQRVKFRQCLLPLGTDNKVLAVFGGMRCKLYP